MDWNNLGLAIFLLVIILVVLIILSDLLPPKKLFMSQNHNSIYFYGLPLLGIFTNYDELPYVSWGYFFGLSIGIGLMTFVVQVIMNQVTGFVNNLDHNKED